MNKWDPNNIYSKALWIKQFKSYKIMLFLINTYNGKYKFRYGHSVGQIKKITKKGL